MTPDELRALLGEATAGPWVVDPSEPVMATDGQAIAIVVGDTVVAEVPLDDDNGERDAALIVALRNHAEALLDVADEANKLFYGSDSWIKCKWRLRDALDRLEAIE